MLTWTKEAAVAKMQANTVLAEVIRIEPRIQAVINQALSVTPYRGYSRVKTYYRLKRQAYYLVGFEAEKPELRTSTYFDAVVGTIDDLLPPDLIDRIDAGEEVEEVEDE